MFRESNPAQSMSGDSQGERHTRRNAGEPGHRSGSKENESRVGTNVSEVLGGEVGISTLVSVTAPAAGLNSHRSNTNTEQTPSGNILPQQVSCSRGGAGTRGTQGEFLYLNTQRVRLPRFIPPSANGATRSFRRRVYRAEEKAIGVLMVGSIRVSNQVGGSTGTD